MIDASPLVFPSRTGSAVTGFSAPKARLDRLSGVSGWTHHDIRRTVASGLARLGVDVPTIAAVLDHSPTTLSGVTARYNRHRYEREARTALERWADHVLRLADGTSKVVKIA